MKLMKLTLENIKSYKYQEFFFQEGINCILGLNGSGKSTIIESIGATLFDYSPKNLSKMLRYQEKKGSMKLEFEAEDNQIYEISRTIRNKGNNSVKIIDVKTNTILYDNVSDVYSFINKILNIPSEKNLSKLFEEIIAVPQGKFVNAFLETPAKRKENFDKLFELDIYKNLSEQLRKIISQIKENNISILDKDISHINGQTINYDEKKDYFLKMKNNIEKLELHQKDLSNELKILEEQKKSNEQIVKDILTTTSSLQLLHEQSRQINILISQNKENIDEAEKASLIVQKKSLSYKRYLDSDKALRQAELELVKYQGLEKDLLTLEKDLKTLEVEEKNILVNVQNKKKSKGQLLEEKTTRENERIQNKESIDEISNQYRLLDMEIQKIEDEYQKQNNTIIYSINVLKTYQNNLLQETNNINFDNLNGQEKEIDGQLKSIKEDKDTVFALETEKATLYSEIEIFKQNINELSDGVCPFFKQPCLNMTSNNSLSLLANTIKNKETRINEIQEQAAVLSKNINSEASLISELQALKLQKQRKEDYDNRLLNLEKEIDQQFNSFLSNQNCLGVNQKITFLLSLFVKEEQTLEVMGNDLKTKNQAKNKLQNIITTHQVNIESHNRRLDSILKELAVIEKEMLELQNQRLKYNQDSDVLKQKILSTKLFLNNFGNPQLNVDELKDSIKMLKEPYEAYLSSQQKANELLKYQSQDEEYKEQLKAINERRNIKETELEILNKAKENVNSNDINSKYDEINKQYGTNEGSIKEITKQMGVLNKEIIMMDELLLDLKTKQQQLEKYISVLQFLNTTREILVSLPKELSLRYREYISNLGSILYSQISGENVRLELLEDYGIILIDNIDNNKEKAIEQLSGGEQMSVAIAMRLAMLKQVAGVNIYFMDEPTTNLDIERRSQVAEVMQEISKDLNQLFVISHDDTFDNITDNVIKVIKNDNISTLDI